MASTHSTPSGVPYPRENIKYRTSCDRCANIKVRCSQDKPACKRCAQRRIACTYSPLRRMGRPRRASHTQTASPGLVHRSDVGSPSPGLATPTSPLPDADGDAIGDGNASREHQSDIDMAIWGIGSAAGAIERARDGSVGAPVMESSEAETSPDSGFQMQMSDSTLPGQTGHSAPSTWHPDAFLAPSHEVQPAGSGTSRPVAPDHLTLSKPPIPNPVAANCYVAILSQTTRLEQSILSTPHPTIDVVLDAERNFRLLQSRLFRCVGHGVDTRPCLTSESPVLLVLALLAENIVSLLENIFRLAAEATHPPDWPGPEQPITSLRRLSRSFRCLLDQPCVFPLPAAVAGQEMRIGEGCVVDNSVKARAVKRILLLRVRGLRGSLGEMGLRGARETKRERAAGGNGVSAAQLLDWGRSGPVLDQAAGLVVADLIRRMEALVGGMTLVG